MPADDDYLSINSNKVVSEIFDGECVIIDFGTGNYYSLRGSAPLVWEQLQLGCSLSTIRNWAHSRFIDPAAAIQDSEELVQNLIKEDLVETGTDTVDAAQLSVDSQPSGADKIEYVKMLFERYDDMQEMIGMDPIHEVDENVGWPKKK